MFIKLLQAQLFCSIVVVLFVYCTLCCYAESVKSQSTAEDFDLLFKENSVTPFKPTSTTDKESAITIKDIKTFSLLATKELMVAVVEATENTNSNEQTYILAKYIETSKPNWKENTVKTESSNSKWKTQLVTKNKSPDKKYFALITSVVNEKENKIYIFVVNRTEPATEENPKCISYEKMEITLVVGTVGNEEQSSPSDKTITWKENKLSKFTDGSKFSKLLISDVRSFVSNEGKILLVFKGKNDKSKKQNVFAFVNLTQPEYKLDLLRVDAIEDCNPHLFTWEKEKIIVVNHCQSEDNGKLIELINVKKWNNGIMAFSRLWWSLKDKKDFTPATISNTNLFLFTQQEKKKDTEVIGKNNNYLFISDGTHVKKIEVVAEDVNSVEPVRLLFTDGELFTLHRKTNGDGHKNIILTRQQKLLAEIKSVVDIWKNADSIIKAQCTGSSEKNILCIRDLPTDHVVGFLSDNASGTGTKIWHDEYHYVNAAVDKGEQVRNGFKFAEVGAKAVWSVGKTEEGTLYNFANFGFTLVATVNIDQSLKTGQQRPVLGVTYENGKDKEGVSVFCSKEKMFAVSDNKEISADKTLNKKCVVGKQYQVALVYKNKTVFPYVDWEPFGGGHKFEISEDSQKDLQFYFGAASNGGSELNVASHVTVRNVLLYNRPFNDGEIKKLKTNNENNNAPLPLQKIEKNIYQDNRDEDNGLEIPDITSEEAASSSGTLTTHTNTAKNEEEVQPSLHPRENAAIVDLNVRVLFALLNVWVVMFCLFDVE